MLENAIKMIEKVGTNAGKYYEKCNNMAGQLQEHLRENVGKSWKVLTRKND